MMTLESAPKQMERGLDALVSLRLTESQAEKIGLGDQWRAARNRTLLRQQRKLDAQSRLSIVVTELMELARDKEISQRKLLKQLDLSTGSWMRCRQGSVEPKDWLPKLEAALARLKAS